MLLSKRALARQCGALAKEICAEWSRRKKMNELQRGVRSPRLTCSSWHMDVSPNEAFDKIVEAAKKLSQEQHELFEDAEVSKVMKEDCFASRPI